jgi:hypothetical protein
MRWDTTRQGFIRDSCRHEVAGSPGIQFILTHRRSVSSDLSGVNYLDLRVASRRNVTREVFVVALRFRRAAVLLDFEADLAFYRARVFFVPARWSHLSPCNAWLAFQFRHIRGGRLWACGRRLRRWATQPRSGALSTVAAGAPHAHRPHVHSLPGAKRPVPAASQFFGCRFRLRPAPQRPCADRQGPSP